MDSEDWSWDQECGSNTAFEVDVTDDNGSPVDMTNASAVWLIALNYTTPAAIIYTSPSTLTLSSGKITGNLLPADTLRLGVAKDTQYMHKMYLTLSGQQQVLIQKGTINFKPSLRQQ